MTERTPHIPDSEGIRAPAGRAQWISSPSPWPLGHTVSEDLRKEAEGWWALAEDESCGGGVDICEQHRALRMALGPQKQRPHPSMDTKVPP